MREHEARVVQLWDSARQLRRWCKSL